MKTPQEQTGTSKKSSRAHSRRSKIGEILVPIDFSDASKRALDYAALLAKQLEARVTVVNVVEPLPTTDAPEVPASRTRDLSETHQALDLLASREVGRDLLNPTQVLIGKPFEQIIKVAKAVKADLILVAAHGHTEWEKGILGSTADRLIRLASCPVLIVP